MKKIGACANSLLIFVSLLGGDWAYAQAAKKKTVGELLRQENRGGSISSREKVGIALPQAQAIAPTPTNSVNLNQVKPPRMSSFMSNNTGDQAQLEKITDQQINELFKLTQRFKNSKQRGELWLRLAELYVEKASIIDFRKQGEYDIQLRDFQAGKTKVKPKLDLREAREYNRKALQLYEWFARDFPNDEKMDQALFFLGYNNYEIGELKKGTAYYTKLTSEYPKSAFITESNFALAEYYFENEKWSFAKDYYTKVLQRKKHRLYPLSLYKLAWCDFRLGNTAQALRIMETLIHANKQAESESKKGLTRSRLDGEALRDIVLFYSEVGEAEKAPSYFYGLAGNEANSYVEKLAYLYSDKGNLVAARVLFNYLIKQTPTAPKAFDYKYQIVKILSTAKGSKEFREEIYSWIQDFSKGSRWAQANARNAELLDNSYRLRETTLRNFVLQNHQTAQNSRAEFSQNLAMEGYRLYLSEFKEAPAAPDMHFYFAELLYDMKKFDEASAQYRLVIESGTKSKYYSKAAENIVVAQEKDLPSDAAISARVGQTLDPVQLDPKVENFINIGKWYLQKFPETDKAVEIKFRTGRLYYQHNQLDSAIPYFKEIVRKYPNTKYSEYSANLLLDIFNLKKDYEGLEKTGQELLAVPSIADSKAGSDIRNVIERAAFKKGQDLEVSKDYAGSATAFENFARTYPRSSLATTAYFNAAINYERAGQSHKAMNAHSIVLASKDPAAEGMKTKARRIVAKLYQDSGQLEQAARAYHSAGKEAGNDPVAPALFYNAGILYEALEKDKETIENYELYFQKEKKSERVEVLFSIASIHRKRGQISRAVDGYKDYLARGPRNREKMTEAAYWIYHLSGKLNRIKDTEDWKKRTLSFQKQAESELKGAGAVYAAKVKFDDAQLVYRELTATRVPADPRKQQAAVQRKIALVTRLTQDLAEVIRYDSPEEIVGALALIGHANLHMGDSLIGAPLPAGLNAEETAQYKQGVQKLADPFFQKARESFQAALDRGSDLDVYDESYRSALDGAIRLDPKKYYKGPEVGFEIRQGSWGSL